MEELRMKIDKIDDEILNLFIERMKVVRDIALYKLEHKLPILDENRERELIEKRVKIVKDLCIKDLYEEFYVKILDISKRLQERIIEEE